MERRCPLADQLTLARPGFPTHPFLLLLTVSTKADHVLNNPISLSPHRVTCVCRYFGSNPIGRVSIGKPLKVESLFVYLFTSPTRQSHSPSTQ